MSAALSPPPFAIVIDTDTYAGNFEREMCAYITGRVGDCGVGVEQAAQAKKKLPAFVEAWIETNITSAPDKNGCNRPASIWPSVGVFNDGHGNEWHDNADPEQVRIKYEASVRGYYEPLITSKIHLVDEPARHGCISWARQIEIWKETIADSIARGPGRFPAYQSVAIFCGQEPTSEIWAVIKERAKAFRSKWPKYTKKPKIIGFRMVKLELKTTELKVPE